MGNCTSSDPSTTSSSSSSSKRQCQTSTGQAKPCSTPPQNANGAPPSHDLNLDSESTASAQGGGAPLRLTSNSKENPLGASSNSSVGADEIEEEQRPAVLDCPSLFREEETTTTLVGAPAGSSTPAIGGGAAADEITSSKAGTEELPMMTMFETASTPHDQSPPPSLKLGYAGGGLGGLPNASGNNVSGPRAEMNRTLAIQALDDLSEDDPGPGGTGTDYLFVSNSVDTTAQPDRTQSKSIKSWLSELKHQEDDVKESIFEDMGELVENPLAGIGDRQGSMEMPASEEGQPQRSLPEQQQQEEPTNTPGVDDDRRSKNQRPPQKLTALALAKHTAGIPY